MGDAMNKQHFSDAQDARIALMSKELSLQSRICIAGELSARCSLIDAEQVWQAIDYLHGLQ